MPCTIAVQKLRVGMFIQLDVGWLSHPFPRSAFRISDAEQLATVRALGLAEVNWIPEKSLLEDEVALHEGAAASKAVLQSLVDEYELMMQLRHPNVLTFKDLATRSPDMARVMRLAERAAKSSIVSSSCTIVSWNLLCDCTAIIDSNDSTPSAWRCACSNETSRVLARSWLMCSGP